MGITCVLGVYFKQCQSKRILFASFLSAIVFASPVFAQVAPDTMTDIGTLGGSGSAAYGANSDGTTVVGFGANASGRNHAFRWTSAGMSDLGTLGGNTSYAKGASSDGSVIVGHSDAAGGVRAFRWTSAGGMTDLGTLGGSRSYATGVNSAGDVVVGQSYNAAGQQRAFRWTSAGGMVDLGTLGGATSLSAGVNSDGSVIVGRAAVASGQNHAFRWTSAGGMTDLGTLGGTFGQANGVSSDGSVVVGQSKNAAGQDRAFRWTSAGMADIGTLGGSTAHAFGVSGDGNTVAGFSQNATGATHAFRWTSSGMTDLGVLPGGTYSQALGISADGSVVVGRANNASNQTRAFIYKTNMLDLANTQTTISQAASSQASAVASRSVALRQSMGTELGVGRRPARQSNSGGLFNSNSGGLFNWFRDRQKRDKEFKARLAEQDRRKRQARQAEAERLRKIEERRKAELARRREEDRRQAEAARQQREKEAARLREEARIQKEREAARLLEKERRRKAERAQRRAARHWSRRRNKRAHRRRLRIRRAARRTAERRRFARYRANRRRSGLQRQSKGQRYTYAELKARRARRRAAGSQRRSAAKKAYSKSLVRQSAARKADLRRELLRRQRKHPELKPIIDQIIERQNEIFRRAGVALLPGEKDGRTAFENLSSEELKSQVSALYGTLEKTESKFNREEAASGNSSGVRAGRHKSRRGRHYTSRRTARIRRHRRSRIRRHRYRSRSKRHYRRRSDLRPASGTLQAIQSTRGGETTRPIALQFNYSVVGSAESALVQIAGVNAEVGLNNAYTLGGFLTNTSELTSKTGFRMSGSQPAGGLYLRWRDPVNAQLTWKVAAAGSIGRAIITRTSNLVSTEAGHGETTMQTMSASAEVGYSFAAGPIQVSPVLKLATASSIRGGYTEVNDISFPVTFNKLVQTETTLSLGINGSTTVGQSGSFSFGLGVERDLSRSNNPVTGSSAVPGMTTFSVAGPTVINPTRAFASVGYTRTGIYGGDLSVGLNVAQTAFTNAPTFGASMSFELKF